MNVPLKRRLWIIVGGGVALIALAWAVVYVLSLRSLTVNYTHVHSVVVYSSDALDSGNASKPRATITQSGKPIKLPKGSYTLHYSGDAGYQSRYVKVQLNDTKTISVDPEFSDSTLANILQAELPSIQSVLASKYSQLGLYSLQTGQLYKQGEWYGTTLKYQGSDAFNADTLRVILHEENGTWVVKTNPPDISLSKFIYPDVPEWILTAVNNQ